MIMIKRREKPSFGHLNFAPHDCRDLSQGLISDLFGIGQNKKPVETSDKEVYENLICDDFLLFAVDYVDTSLSQFAN